MLWNILSLVNKSMKMMRFSVMTQAYSEKENFSEYACVITE